MTCQWCSGGILKHLHARIVGWGVVASQSWPKVGRVAAWCVWELAMAFLFCSAWPIRLIGEGGIDDSLILWKAWERPAPSLVAHGHAVWCVLYPRWWGAVLPVWMAGVGILCGLRPELRRVLVWHCSRLLALSAIGLWCAMEAAYAIWV